MGIPSRMAGILQQVNPTRYGKSRRDAPAEIDIYYGCQSAATSIAVVSSAHLRNVITITVCYWWMLVRVVRPLPVLYVL